MSKNETTQAQDLFSIYQQNSTKLFNSAKQFIPQYHQAFTNIQQECVAAYKSVMDSAVALQQTYIKKSGLAATVPEATMKAIQTAAADVAKTVAVQNQVALAAIDATQKSVKIFNDNAESLIDLNKNIFQSWTSALSTK